LELQTVKELRIEARLTVLQLAAQAGVSISSINRIEHAKNPVKRLVVSKVLHTLSQALGRQIKIEDIEGLELAD
jgi:transcriptional regulator with XRE-family HTH domain